MNKLVTVLGVAAVATLAGCKDPNYKPMFSQGEVKVVAPDPAAPAVAPVSPAAPSCKCPPGTRHASPCTCGAPDCACVVVQKPLPPPPPPEPEYTVYIVQGGDYLAKISKRYNLTINSIKQLNGLKGDTIRVGQRLKLPGKVDVGVQKAPAKAAAPHAAADYAGETKEYVVKSGDTLGAIAYGNGCNIRQLKKLNGLQSDSLKVGQKLKVPAKGKAAAAPKPAPVKSAAVTPVKKNSVAPPEPKEPAVEPTPTPEPAPEPTPEPAPEPPADSSVSTYTVQEGDDMTGVSIRFGVSASAIRELNNLPEDAQLKVGDVIKLPADAQQ